MSRFGELVALEFFGAEVRVNAGVTKIVTTNGRVTGEFDRRDATETLVIAASAKGHAPTPIQEPAA